MNFPILFRAKAMRGEQPWVYGTPTISSSGCWMFPNNLQGQNLTVPIKKDTIQPHIGVYGFESKKPHRQEGDKILPLFLGDIVEAWSEGSKCTAIIAMRRTDAPIFFLYPAWSKGQDWHLASSDLKPPVSGIFYDDMRVVGNIIDDADEYPKEIAQLKSAAPHVTAFAELSQYNTF